MKLLFNKKLSLFTGIVFSLIIIAGCSNINKSSNDKTNNNTQSNNEVKDSPNEQSESTTKTNNDSDETKKMKRILTFLFLRILRHWQGMGKLSIQIL